LLAAGRGGSLVAALLAAGRGGGSHREMYRMKENKTVIETR
jgi:hypothetical protein